MKIRSSLFVLAAACALAGCSTAYRGDVPGALVTPDFGNAVRTDVAAQTVNPEAPRTDTTLTASGALTAAAVDRYEHDAVKKPADTGSSGGGTSVSGSSGR